MQDHPGTRMGSSAGVLTSLQEGEGRGAHTDAPGYPLTDGTKELRDQDKASPRWVTSTPKTPMTLFHGDSDQNVPPNPNLSILSQEQRIPNVKFPPGPQGREQRQEAQQGPEDLVSLSRSPCGTAQGLCPLAASSAPGTSAPRTPQVIPNENNCLLGSERHDLCLPKPRAGLAKLAGSCSVCPGVRVAWGGPAHTDVA